MNELVIIQQVHPDAIALLGERPEIGWCLVEDTTPETLEPLVANAVAIAVRVSELPESLLDAAPALRVVSRHGVGYDNVPVDYCTRRGIAVTTTGDANSNSVAEHTFYLMLSAARAGTETDRAVRSGDYAVRSRIIGREMSGKTLLVVGYGRIGRRVAALASAFGMRVAVHDPYLPHGTDLGDHRLVAVLEEGLEQAEFLSLHLPLTTGTRGIIGPAELDLLPADAILVNASRGGLVDEAALLERVSSGRLFGAGLDTFEVEPLPPDSPLFAEPRIVISPHSAALTDNSLRAMGIQTIQNAIDGIDGTLDPRMVVNPEVLG